MADSEYKLGAIVGVSEDSQRFPRRLLSLAGSENGDWPSMANTDDPV
jgi:hypothetical protein